MITAEKITTMPPVVAAVAIDPEWSVNELLRLYPATARVLNARGIDTCCGGAIPLSVAAREAQLDLGSLLDALGTVGRGSAA